MEGTQRADAATAVDGPATSPSDVEAARGRGLAELGSELGATDAATRVLAFDALRTLSVSRVDEVEARLRELRLNDEPPSAAAYNTLQDIRHHLGSQRADDPVDLARGARQLLSGARAPSRTLVQVAERMALLRALEGMDALAADRVMIGFFQRAWSVWQWEARHLVARRGLGMLAALIEARSAGNPEVRRWAVGSIRRLGVDSVGAAVQMASIEDLPDVLRAYASLSDLNAMPAVITFVDHADPAVRAASREATASYERNAIWQLRLAHRNKLGENADLGWSWQTTMQRLFDGLDARRLAPANELLDEGLAAAASESWAEMHDRFDRALRREPLLPRRAEMGPGYATEALVRLGSADVSDDAPLRAALTLLRRAIRLAPDHAAASEWRATVAFQEAERARRAGVLDEGAYQAVLATQPKHAAARAVLADIEDGGVGEVEASGSSMVAWLLALLGVLLLLPYARLAVAFRVAWQQLGRSRGALHRRYAARGHQPPRRDDDVRVPAEPFHAEPLPAEPLPAEPFPTQPFVGTGLELGREEPLRGVLVSPTTGVRVEAPVGVEPPVSVPAEQAEMSVRVVGVDDPEVGVLAGPQRSALLRGVVGAFAASARVARRLSLFAGMLLRRVRPQAISSGEAPGSPGRVARVAGALVAVVSKRAPGLRVAGSRVQRGVGTLKERGEALAKRPKPSVRELASTLAMMSRSEPPPAPYTSAPREVASEPLSAGERAVLTGGIDERAAAPWAGVLDADALGPDQGGLEDMDELDQLLFGDSRPGLDSRDQSLETDESVGHDASDLPDDVIQALARMAHDTSPGLLDAPDTLPG